MVDDTGLEVEEAAITPYSNSDFSGDLVFLRFNQMPFHLDLYQHKLGAKGKTKGKTILNLSYCSGILIQHYASSSPSTMQETIAAASRTPQEMAGMVLLSQVHQRRHQRSRSGLGSRQRNGLQKQQAPELIF